MKATNNFIFITIEKEFEDKISSPSGKIELDLMSFKDDLIDKETDEIIYNVNQKRVNYGTVIAVPLSLTKDVLLTQESPGLPEPSRYVGHDTVMKVGVDMIQYDCGVYEPTWITLNMVPQDVKVGDKVYFHYNTLQKENKIKLKDGREIYKLAYQNALCVVRKGLAIDIDALEIKDGRTKAEVLEEIIDKYEKQGVIIGTPEKVKVREAIIPVSGHVLIEPVYDEDVIDLGGGRMGRQSNSLLITEVDVKPRPLEGIVRYTCNPLEGQKVNFTPGEKIIFVKHANWEVPVEGKTYYCMKYWDVIAKIEPSL